MSDDELTISDDNVHHLGESEWHAAGDLADRLDISVRTVYRRLERGSIEKKETPRGTLYRVAPEPAADNPRATIGDTVHGTEFGEAVLRLVDELGAKSDRLAELSGDVARLEAELEAAREDRARLMRYVEESDQRMDELVDELEATEADLRQTRARAYLQEGRRDLADERLEDARKRVESLTRENSRLERRIEELEAEKDKRWF